ncbi:hypothetical protein SUSAZ_08540 [Sulfolobus acidocaldarius SUSAZ]|nr:hypothetical protein SUSAZ_08540 [Sulfolobus acidocaldarius SUSAZ]
MNLNIKTVAMISVAALLLSMLVYQAFVAGFVVSNSVTGSVVRINSENALLQIDPLEFSLISNNGGLSIQLPAIGPGTADYAAFLYDSHSNVVASYSAAYLFAIVEVEFNYPGNNNQMINIAASLEHVTNNTPIQILVLGTHGSTMDPITSFPNNSISVDPTNTPGTVMINGLQFTVLGSYGLPSSVSSAIGNTTASIGSGNSNGEVVYVLILLPSYGTVPPSGSSFTAALNFYGYQS